MQKELDKIVINKSIHIKRDNPQDDVNVSSISYVSNENNNMIEMVRYNYQRWYYFYAKGQSFDGTEQCIRYSTDHGKAWKKTEDFHPVIKLPSDRNILCNPVEFFFDLEAGCLVKILNEAEEIPNQTVWDEASLIQKTRRIYIQVSKDGGKTWNAAEQIIIKGEEYNFVNWGKGIKYGENSAMVEGTHPIKLPNDKILLPMMRYLSSEEASKYYPDDDSFLQVFQAGFLIGSWRDDYSGIDWEQGDYIPNRNECSSFGFDEPSTGILPDGKLFTILRACVEKNRKFKYPSTKYYSISSDYGYTWSSPEPLRYTDGEIVYSPSSIANVFSSSKNGRFYMITNIIDEPTHGDDPRNVLQIAEIDTKTMTLIKDTVTVIEKYSPELGEPDYTRYSNFRWYEERKTGNIILFVTASGPFGRTDDCKYPAHSFRYDIVLPN